MPGSIDLIDNFGMVGWACAEDRSRPVRIRLDVDGVTKYVYYPNEYRPDLAEAGLAQGKCAIRVQFPEPLAPFDRARVSVFDDETGAELTKPDFALEAAIKAQHRYSFRPPRAVASACPTFAAFESGDVIVRGLATYPTQAALECAVIHGAGEIRNFQQVEATPDLVRRFGLTSRNFEVTFRPEAGQGYTSLQVAPRGFKGRNAWTGMISIGDGVHDHSDAPTEEEMVRVSGPGVDRPLFETAGVTTAAKLAAIPLTYLDQNIDQIGPILDWGAGAGRVARPMRKFFAPSAEIWCADVDGENVSRARERLCDMTWVELPFFPPTKLPEAHFGFVYGISVFTHLSEDAQEVWLAELQRICKSGALLALSANTEYAAVLFSSQANNYLTDLLQHGIADRTPDGNLGPKLQRKSYYRSTYHLTDYIFREWGRYFDVVDVVHGADVNVQDLVILRRR